MEQIKGLAIDLDLDHLKVDRGLKGLKDNLRTVNSEMKRNMSVFDRSERSVSKYETRLTGLNKKLELQKRTVAEAKKEYEEMVKEHGHGSKEAEKAAREYNNQAASLSNLERYISKTKDELVKFQREQRIANSTWTKMGDKLDSYGDKLKGFGGKMNDVGKGMTKKITMPAVGAATAVGGIVAAFGWKRLTSLDAAQAQLKGLGFSMKEVEVISGDVREAVQGTTMTMAEGTSVAAGALAAGVKEGKELEKYIRRVGNAAVGANRPVADMAMIFNRVEGAGKLMTQELNSIEAGMPGFSKAMSKHLGVSTEKMRKMVTDGKVSSKDFMKVMDDFAGGMAKEYAKTWDGMVSNTKANIGIIGETFLRGVFQDSKKSLADFIDMLKSPEIKQKAEEMGEKARIAFNKMKDSISGAVGWYQNLDDEQKTLIKRLGLVAIAGGPVLQFTGKLTSGLGSVLKFTGKLSKAIGVARGAGLVAGLTSLGPTAVAGVAIAGLAGIAAVAYKVYKRKKEANEISLELAETFSDQASQLEESANTFEKLSKKAKLSNEQLAELNDLNIRISQSSNPGEIDELQKRYDDLAKKSGLSKDEIKKLFEANKNIIDQTPKVEKSISDQGNAFAKNTDAVKKQIQALRDLSESQLKGERAKLLEQEAEARRIIAEKTKEQEKVEERLSFLYDNQNLSKDELNQKIAETEEKLKGVNRNTEEGYKLDQIHTDLINIKKERVGETVDELTKQNDQLNKAIEAEQKKLDKLSATEQQMINIKLANAGINEEGAKGLAQLDKSIEKNQQELDKLEQKRQKNGELTEKEQERYDKLSATNEKQREARDLIYEEYGVYSNLNSLVQQKLDMADEQTQKNVESLGKLSEIKVEEGNIVKQIQNQNSEYDKKIEKLKKQKKAEGANKDEIDKQIKALQTKKQKNDANIEAILRELGVWDQVKNSIDLGTQKEKEKGNAVDGTKKKLDAQGNQIDSNNKKTDAGIKKEQARTKEAGKDVTKNVTAKDNDTVYKINNKAEKPVDKKVNLYQVGLRDINREASNPVTKVINFVGRGLSKLKFWEKGTPPSGHPGGPAVIGEKGSELVKLPSGRSFISPSSHTLLDLPRGSHVIPHQQTERIMKAMPRYANGTNGWSTALGNSELARLLTAYNRSSDIGVSTGNSGDDGAINKLLEATLEQNKILLQLLAKDNNTYIDSRSFGRGIEPVITEIQNRNKKVRGSFA